ncbi:F204A protein, partial [Urocolius indicus]|nr:F204A protein [Urocolius indicus]
MWSGLLPPGLTESDVDLSSDDGDELRVACSKEDTKEFQENGPESNAISEPSVIAAANGENDSETCPAGVSLDIWNKFLELQKKNHEMKAQVNQENRSRKRRRRRKGVLDNYRICQQLEDEDTWKELTQYFGINDRFESPAERRAPQKSSLELCIEKYVAEGDIDKAEELSDRLATRELGVKIAKAAACRNFVKAKQEAEAAQEARKKKKLAWG